MLPEQQTKAAPSRTGLCHLPQVLPPQLRRMGLCRPPQMVLREQRRRTGSHHQQLQERRTQPVSRRRRRGSAWSLPQAQAQAQLQTSCLEPVLSQTRAWSR